MPSPMMNRFLHFVAPTVRRSSTLQKLGALIGGRRVAVQFLHSDQYWQERYESGGNSGEGSYGKLSKYKANYINSLVINQNINSVIEFGCGDGNQATLFKFQNYTGIDISKKCIAYCQSLFIDRGFIFQVLEDYLQTKISYFFDLSMSLDVIYHLVEDDTYHHYLKTLFDASSRYVLIYSSNFDTFNPDLPHVRHREFTRDVDTLYKQWKLVEIENNPYSKPHDSKEYGSFAKFHLFERQ